MEKFTKTISIAKLNDSAANKGEITFIDTPVEVEWVEDQNIEKPDMYLLAAQSLLPGTNGKWTDEKLMRFAEFMVKCGNLTYAALSRKIGKEENYIAQLLWRHPQLRQYIKELRQQWFEEQMALAQSVYTDAMVNPDVPWTNKLAAAKDVMSKAGYDAVSKVENTNREVVVELNLDED